MSKAKGELIQFGPIQSNIIQQLAEAHSSATPWLDGKRLLHNAGSQGMRMRDLFKTQPLWQEVVQSNKRGILSLKTPPEARYGESKCKVCPYVGLCKPAFEAKEDLTLLYGIDSRAAPHLEAQGITTISQLADLPTRRHR